MSEELIEQHKLDSQLDAEFPVRPSLVGKIKNWRSGLGQRWAQLHTNQIIYTIAIVLFFVVDGDIEEPNTMIWWVGVLAFFGMARELWSIFIRVWESTFGRLVLLVIYAAIANFTLAVAAQKVNTVIGADPTQLYHTLGVTTLLILPLWLMIFSVVGMIAIFGFMQILRLFRGMLFLLRIISRKTPPSEAFPKTFIIVRLILLAPVTMTLLTLLKWYSDQLNLPEIPGVTMTRTASQSIDDNVANVGLNLIEEELQKDNISDEKRADLLLAKQKLEDSAANKAAEQASKTTPAIVASDTADESSEPSTSENSEETVQIYFLDNVIASFVYNYETFLYSHCQKTPEERVVYISDEDVLVVKKDPQQQSGYAFSTRPCMAAN